MYKVLNPLYTSVFNNGLPNNNKHNYLWDLWLLVKNFKAEFKLRYEGFVIFKFRRYEKIVLKRRLKSKAPYKPCRLKSLDQSRVAW